MFVLKTNPHNTVLMDPPPPHPTPFPLHSTPPQFCILCKPVYVVFSGLCKFNFKQVVPITRFIIKGNTLTPSSDHMNDFKATETKIKCKFVQRAMNYLK